MLLTLGAGCDGAFYSHAGSMNRWVIRPVVPLRRTADVRTFKRGSLAASFLSNGLFTVPASLCAGEFTPRLGCHDAWIPCKLEVVISATPPWVAVHEIVCRVWAGKVRPVVRTVSPQDAARRSDAVRARRAAGGVRAAASLRAPTAPAARRRTRRWGLSRGCVGNSRCRWRRI